MSFNQRQERGINEKKPIEREEKQKRQKCRYYFDCISYHNCTKLLVPRNGTNVEERINIEYIENL